MVKNGTKHKQRIAFLDEETCQRAAHEGGETRKKGWIEETKNYHL